MKNITKRIIAVGALLSIVMTSATGCNSVRRHTSSSSETPTAEAPMLEMPLEFIDPDENSDNPLSEYDIDLTGDDPVAEDTTQVVVENATEYIKVTDDKGQPVTEVQQATQADGQPATEIQKMTEPDGQPATDENGEQKTQVVNATVVVEKTQVVNVTDADGQIVTQVSNSTVTTAANSYTPKQKSRYAMWLDISEDKNFFFEGQFLKYTFKVKDGIPDGDYKIKLAPDFSDVTGTSVYADKVIDGVIRVNNGSVEKVDVASETGLIVYDDSVACKQGDTVDLYVSIKNNSGIVAFVMKLYYDGNALELVNNGAAGEFEEISSKKTDFGEANNNSNN